MAAIDVRRMFDRFAHLYDTGWVQRALYAAVQDRVLAELRSRQPRSVLDVGCGTGIFADRLDRELVPGGVIGCDLSAGMLAQAKLRTGRVHWLRGDSARLALRTGAVDAVVCTQAFHFFDQPAAWREFRRVLVPGGHAVVGMMNPRTAAGSRRFTAVSTSAAKTPVRFPTAVDMRRLAVDAGFDVVVQRPVEWRFARVMPLVVTVGRAPRGESPG